MIIIIPTWATLLLTLCVRILQCKILRILFVRILQFEILFARILQFEILFARILQCKIWDGRSREGMMRSIYLIQGCPRNIHKAICDQMNWSIVFCQFSLSNYIDIAFNEENLDRLYHCIVTRYFFVRFNCFLCDFDICDTCAQKDVDR